MGQGSRADLRRHALGMFQGESEGGGEEGVAAADGERAKERRSRQANSPRDIWRAEAGGVRHDESSVALWRF